jgi:hypothetical protein
MSDPWDQHVLSGTTKWSIGLEQITYGIAVQVNFARDHNIMQNSYNRVKTPLTSEKGDMC